MPDLVAIRKLTLRRCGDSHLAPSLLTAAVGADNSSFSPVARLTRELAILAKLGIFPWPPARNWQPGSFGAITKDPKGNAVSEPLLPGDLPKGWYELKINPGVDEHLPGIYEWEIEGIGSYIGKYTRISRPKKRYGRNVSRILNDEPYWPSKRDGFRLIHRVLAKAYSDGLRITLTILENVAPSKINGRESELIAERGKLNVPPFGKSTR
jgi:hypothetical protein